MRYVLVAVLRGYRAVVSPIYGDVCRYHPSCSAYALEAVQRHGATKGSWLAVRRVARCHPWAAGGLDPVPDEFTWRTVRAPPPERGSDVIDFFVGIGHAIMTPLYYVTSGILIFFHNLFNDLLGMPRLVVGAVDHRLDHRHPHLLIPLFVKQIKNSRNLQLLQPKVKELQKKYGHDRER